MKTVCVFSIALAIAVLGCGATTPDVQNGVPSPTKPLEVVIAAVELQFEDPSPGGQSVWIANRGTAEQDISCLAITAASSGRTAVVRSDTHLAPGRALRFATPARMLGSPETITLADRAGQVIDRTPQLTDSAGDDQLWFVLPGAPWRFGRTRLPEIASDGQLVSAC